jgi:hypothetical protein
MKIDLSKFRKTLPYSSELFGIYQPLLGWKSKRIVKRISLGLASFNPLVVGIASKMTPSLEVSHLNDPREFELNRIGIASVRKDSGAYVNSTTDSFVTRSIAARITSGSLDLNNDAVWAKLAAKDALTEILDEVKKDRGLRANVIDYVEQNHIAASDLAGRDFLLNRESIVAGTLNYLFERKMFTLLRQLFQRPAPQIELDALAELKRFIDPMETFDPKTDIDRVALSPVGMVHLFRQYFFEFDTFLGTPVQHIWLSPGSSLELIEISTRKTTVERTAETAFESVVKTEKSSTEQDDLSDAIKEENQNSTKFGASLSAGTSGGMTTPLYSATAHVEATASYGIENTAKASKESAHKQMRLQSDKISSEIKKNYKTTFKTVTEVTDTSSKRYLLKNDTKALKNYELRRKMRQVGVQVQDIGTQLCWQTYVDLPGKHLGLSNLVHIAQPPDYSSLHAPDPISAPDPIEKDLTIQLPFQSFHGDNDTNAHYVEDGPASEHGHPDGGDVNDKITVNYNGYKAPEIPNFTLQDVRLMAVLENKQAVPEFKTTGANAFDIHLRSVNYDGDSISIQVKLVYGPEKAIVDKIVAANQTNVDKFDAEKKLLAKQTLLKEARDRVKVASSIQPRKFEELREEERIIVYRELIRDLLNVGVLLDNARVRHVMAELISSMFDVDKMLYFVSPDWWMPRQTVNQQNIGGTPNRVFTSDDIVTWGAADTNYRKNYYITEDSAPARLGSSIGWILQLDGDNLRNAFLNAPWVKAVIPIRPGKELAALNWLAHASVEGADSLDARYQESSDTEADDIVAFLESYPWPDGTDKVRYTNFASNVATDPSVFITIRDALKYLALKIKLKNVETMRVRTETVEGEVQTYLPTEKVFEHGFYPLQGGFKAGGAKPFEIFDQWVEILPTDQVVAVEVRYDPKTGMQL